jgi:transcriptional regulator with XRE-family HTH domain
MNSMSSVACTQIEIITAMTLGKRIQRLMKERGLSAVQVARACGITPGAVSNWFSTGRVSKENLAIFCRLAGVDMARFIAGEEQQAEAAKEEGGLSTEAMALGWLLDQVPGRINRVKANHAATEAILRVLAESGAPPIHTPAPRANLEKPPA